MLCEGYKRDAHEVDRLYAKQHCIRCYMAQYREEHVAELAAYQDAYRQGPIYAEQNRAYVRKCRGRD